MRLVRELHHCEHQGSRRRCLSDPEVEEAASKPGLHFGEPLFEPRLELSELRVQFGLQSFHPLLELRIETREIELVQVSEISPICRIDHVEPLHELVGEVVPELLVEFARQSGRDRHGSSRCGVPILIVDSARYGIKKTRLSSTSLRYAQGRLLREAQGRPPKTA